MKFGRTSEAKLTSPYRGVILTAVFGAVLLLIGYGGGLLLRRPRQADDGRPAGGSAKSDSARIPDRTEPGPETKQKELPSCVTDPTVLSRKDDSEALDTEAFYYLLYQLKIADSAKLAEFAKNARPAPPMAQANWKQVNPGDPISLEGTVRFKLSRKDLGIPDEIPKATLYEISDSKGNTHLVFAVYAVVGIEKGDRVNVVGRYLRHWRYVPAGEVDPSKEAPTPVIITRQVDGSRYLDDPSCLDQVKDRQAYQEPKAFYYLVNLVRGLGQAEITRRAEENEDLTPGAIEQSPARARGRFVTVEGSLILTQRHNKPPNIAGIDTLYWCVLRTPGGQVFWVYTLEEPGTLRRKDVVRAYGVFLKSRYYTSQRKFERTSLVMVARRLVRVEYKHSPHLALALVVIGLVTLAGLIIGVIVERRKSREAGRHVRGLAARVRPTDINKQARTVASRTRRARKRLAEGRDEDEAPNP